MNLEFLFFLFIRLLYKGVGLAKELLTYYDIDKSEHKTMWLSWLTVFLFILRNNE